MSGFSAGLLFVMIVVVVAAIGFFGRKRGPKDRFFKCSRCSTVANHTPRTIEAWRSGKTKLFCNSCHGQWLRSQPAPSSPVRVAHSGRARSSGCLGVFVLLIVLPVVGAWVLWA